MATTSRRTRLFRRTDDDRADDDGADLSEDEHAWWAARDEVAAVPTGRRVEEPVPEPATSHFADYWTAESLFTNGPDPAAAPTGLHDPAVHGIGAEVVDEPLELSDQLMDLDAAHLVLQIPVGSDWEAVTKAQRRLAMLYHPDRLLDLSPVAQDLGRDRMAEINAAHATLRALHFH